MKLPAAAVKPQTGDQLARLEAQLRERDDQLAALATERVSRDDELARLRAEAAQAKAANPAQPDTHDYSEALTRSAYIDVLLHEGGWPLDQPRDREFEVHGMPNAQGTGYVDYVLWGDDGKPLALVEAKRTTRAARCPCRPAAREAVCRLPGGKLRAAAPDRVALVNQAARAFTKFLPGASPVNLVTEKDTDGRVFVSTYPTMMGLIEDMRGGEREGERRFGVGHFDLIVIDEAHRSVYQKYGAIFEYFDAMVVGLTATPRDEVARDTYRLFNLERGVPTDAYALEDAVSDGYLVPAKAVSVPLKFQRFGLGLGGMVCPCLITETKRLGPFLLQRSLCWEPRFNQSLALPKVIPRKPLALDYRLQRTPAFSSSSLALCCANQVS